MGISLPGSVVRKNMQKAGATGTNIVWIAGNNLFKKGERQGFEVFFEAFLIIPLGSRFSRGIIDME